MLGVQTTCNEVLGAPAICKYDGRLRDFDEICPVWAQRMAAWAEEARDRLKNGSFDCGAFRGPTSSPATPGKED